MFTEGRAPRLLRNCQKLLVSALDLRVLKRERGRTQEIIPAHGCIKVSEGSAMLCVSSLAKPTSSPAKPTAEGNKQKTSD